MIRSLSWWDLALAFVLASIIGRVDGDGHTFVGSALVLLVGLSCGYFRPVWSVRAWLARRWLRRHGFERWDR